MKNDITVVVTGKPGVGKTTVRLLLQEALTAHGLKWTLEDPDEAEGEFPGSEAKTRADYDTPPGGAYLPAWRKKWGVQGLVRIKEQRTSRIERQPI